MPIADIRGSPAPNCQVPLGWCSDRFPAHATFLALGEIMSYYKYMSEPAAFIDFGLTPEQEDRAKELHQSIVVFDTLMECSWYDGVLENVKRGGTTAGSFSIGTAGLPHWKGRKEGITARPEDWWTAETLVKDIAFVNRKAREHADEMMLCYSAADIQQAKKDGKTGFMLDVQNTNFLGNQPDRMEVFYDLGLRRIQLTYNRSNAAGCGCMEVSDEGLSIWGREIVEQMNEIGILVDTGHCKPQTLIDAIGASSKPIACSHAGMSSRVRNPRTQSDDALRKLADNGGVFGIVSTPGALKQDSAYCSVNDYLDSIEAAVNLIGIDHVAFGTDLILAASLEEILSAPEWGVKAQQSVGVDAGVWPWSDGHKGMENNSGYPNLTRGLVGRGYSDEDIAKIMGGNFVRLIEETIG